MQGLGFYLRGMESHWRIPAGEQYNLTYKGHSDVHMKSHSEGAERDRVGGFCLLIQLRYDDVSYGVVRSGQVFYMFLYISLFSKVEPIGSDGELNVGGERKRRIKDDTKVFHLSYWKDGVAVCFHGENCGRSW